jgi:hypothetical protein
MSPAAVTTQLEVKRSSVQSSVSRSTMPEHLRGEVDADQAPGRADALLDEREVDPRPAGDVEHSRAGTQFQERDRSRPGTRIQQTLEVGPVVDRREPPVACEDSLRSPLLLRSHLTRAGTDDAGEVKDHDDDHDDRDHGDEEYDGRAAASSVGWRVVLGQAGHRVPPRSGICVS